MMSPGAMYPLRLATQSGRKQRTGVRCGRSNANLLVTAHHELRICSGLTQIHRFLAVLYFPL
jgi:hypothetical protein